MYNEENEIRIQFQVPRETASFATGLSAEARTPVNFCWLALIMERPKDLACARNSKQDGPGGRIVDLE